jgi:very-short-patch-repair endonuclease
VLARLRRDPVGPLSRSLRHDRGVPDAIDETCDMRIQRRTRGADAEIAALAARQDGVVARRQLLALGLGGDAIGRRLRAGRLHRVHRGVYAVGHPLLSGHGVWMAAVLVAEGAVLSHRSAAGLWGIRQSDRVEITVPAPLRPRSAITVHRAALQADETSAHRTRSELENRFLAFLDAERLPRPRTNATVEGYEVDFHWARARLVVELDGYATHATRNAFEEDRARDRRLQLAGYRVLRITARQLSANTNEVAGQLRSTLTGSP